MNAEEIQAKSEQRLRKIQQAATARAQAMAYYVSEAEKRKILSSKLKMLRLAREAEELAAARISAKKKPSVRKKLSQ